MQRCRRNTERKKKQLQAPGRQHTHTQEFSLTRTWPHLEAPKPLDEPRARSAEAAPPASCPRASSRALVSRWGLSRVPGDTRPPSGVPRRRGPGAGGRARWGGRAAGPGLGARGGDKGRERGGARLTWASGRSEGPLGSRGCPLARGAGRGGGGGEGAGAAGGGTGGDGGGVGLEPSGGASCPGRCRALARRAPSPALRPAVPSSARARAPAGSAPGLPPE